VRLTPGKKFKILSEKEKEKRTGVVAQVVEHLLGKYSALSSDPSTTKKIISRIESLFHLFYWQVEIRVKEITLVPTSEKY
jgi:hypothetical protein